MKIRQYAQQFIGLPAVGYSKHNVIRTANAQISVIGGETDTGYAENRRGATPLQHNEEGNF